MPTACLAIAAKREEALRLQHRATGDIVDRLICEAQGAQLGPQHATQIHMRLGPTTIDDVRIA